MRVRLVAGVLALLATGHAAAAERACMTPRQASALLVSLTPSLLDVVGKRCAATLPANAYLPRNAAGVAARYRAAGDRLGNETNGAIATLLNGDKDAAMFQTEAGRRLMTEQLGLELVKDIKPAQCRAVDDLFGKLDALQPEQAAAVFVTILRLSGGGKDDKLPICAQD